MRSFAVSVALALASILPPPAIAEGTYQTEIVLNHSRTSAESITETNGPGVGATFFFDALPIDPREYPAHEGPFIERVGSVSVDYARLSQNVDGYRELESGYTSGITLLARRPDSSLYGRFRYKRAESGRQAYSGSSSISHEFGVEGDTRELALGAYLSKASLLTIEAARESYEQANSGYTAGTYESTVDRLGLTGRHLAPLSAGAHLAAQLQLERVKHKLETSITVEPKYERISLQGTYYPTRTLALTAGISDVNGDNGFADGTIYLFGVDAYLRPSMNVFLRWEKFFDSADVDATDSKRVALGLVFRF
jgi:hypothetical protein